MQRLLAPGTRSHIFTRHDDRGTFTYWGMASPTNPRGTSPMMLTWVFAREGSPARANPNHALPRVSGAQGSSDVLHGDYRTARGRGDVEAASEEISILRRNPALLERALLSHSSTQNALADVVRGAGLKPTSPRGSVDYDLAWRLNGRLWVAEVKSLTDANEVAQMRLGIGQLLDYAAALEHLGEHIEGLVLAVERHPSAHSHWMRVCHRAGIRLCVAPEFTGLGL
jgi:hypothetical protein